MHGPCIHVYSMRKAASCTTFSCTDSQVSVRLLLQVSVRQPVYSNVTVSNHLKSLGSMCRERAGAVGRCGPRDSPRLGQAATQVRWLACTCSEGPWQ